MQKDREQRVECKKGNVCPWLIVTNGKMFAKDGVYGTKHDFSKEPHGTVRKLTVDNIAIRRTNGAPKPSYRIAAEPGTEFGSLSISNVTLDGVGVE